MTLKKAGSSIASRHRAVAGRVGISDVRSHTFYHARGLPGPAKGNMHIQNIKSAAQPRRRLSLRFSENPRQLSQPIQPLPRKELQRIVAEMLG